LSKAHVLVYGMKGTIVENIVLSGVESLTLIDDRIAFEEAFSSNFLIPLDENVYGGKTLAQLCCDSLKKFNPMVHVYVQKGDLSTFDVGFFNNFDVVVVSSCSLPAKDYKYSKEALSVPWRELPRKISKLYFAMRVIEKFEEAEGCSAGEVSVADLPGVLKLKKQLCAEQSLNESHVPDIFLERLVTSRLEFPPVIKAISEKGDPLKNFFFFDAFDMKGIIENISNSNA
ncbi:hypothetical protein S245_009409, partial [Arachis hypogaea]